MYMMVEQVEGGSMQYAYCQREDYPADASYDVDAETIICINSQAFDY